MKEKVVLSEVQKIEQAIVACRKTTNLLLITFFCTVGFTVIISVYPQIFVTSVVNVVNLLIISVIIVLLMVGSDISRQLYIIRRKMVKKISPPCFAEKILKEADKMPDDVVTVEYGE